MKRTFRTIVPSLLLFIGVSGVAHGQAAGAPSSSNAAAASEEAPAQVRADESADPRLKALSANDQKAYLDEGASSIQYCSNNVILSGFYSCSCFSKKVFDTRMNQLGQMVRGPGGKMMVTPFVNLVSRLDISACVAPAKIPAYATDRTKAVLKMDTQVSPAQLDQISACVSSELTTSFVAKPSPNASAVDGYFNSALVSCREKIVSGNAAAASPGNSASNTDQHPDRAPTPAAAAPIPTTKKGLMGRLKNAINHANGAIEQSTVAHP